jgi:hypothetical protein
MRLELIDTRQIREACHPGLPMREGGDVRVFLNAGRSMFTTALWLAAVLALAAVAIVAAGIAVDAIKSPAAGGQDESLDNGR